MEDDGAGNKKKSVRLGSKTVNAFARNDYDISPYLHRDEKQIPTDVPRAPVENITFRRKTRSQTREEPRLPDIQDTSCVDPSASRKNAPNIKPATYDGTTSWLDYKSHFEACAKLGKLENRKRLVPFFFILRDSAQGVLGNLSDGRKMNYKELVSALSYRFAPPDQMNLYRTQLRGRRQKALESLPDLELGQHNYTASRKLGLPHSTGRCQRNVS